MPPADFVALAADLGVTRIGMACAPFTANPAGYPAWDMRADAALLRQTKAALAEHGVELSLGEGFLIMPGIEIADSAASVDALTELGAPCLNCVVVESDRARALDQFGRFSEMAGSRGAIATIEFLPMQWPATLDEALAFLVDSGAVDARLLIDAMHLYRSGGSAADLARIDPARVGYIQLCDVPMPARIANYGEEAKHERRCPGDGDLPLAEFLAALPRDLTVGLEVPQLSKAQAGIDAYDRLARCVAAARALLAGIGG
jgi:sugar phosphate isomerase/epimerase